MNSLLKMCTLSIKILDVEYGSRKTLVKCNSTTKVEHRVGWYSALDVKPVLVCCRGRLGSAACLLAPAGLRPTIWVSTEDVGTTRPLSHPSDVVTLENVFSRP